MIFNSAYMLINKAIPNTGGPYTVRFYDDNNNLIQTDANIPLYGDAHCTLLDGTIEGGLYFKGWNPSAFGVTRDLDCYPVRGDYVISYEEIHDSWETIVADAGAHYPFGAYKPLVITIPQHTFDVTRESPTGNEYNWSITIPQQNISMHMVKVAEGEDGSSSSWISTGTILGRIQYLTSFSFEFLKTEMAFDWANIPLREWLNNVLLSNLPLPLQSTIKQVSKSYIGALNYYPGAKSNATVEKTSLDKIWVPSLRELYTRIGSYPNFGGIDRDMSRVSLSSYAEVNGIDYSTVYVPTYSMDNNHGYFLRSAVYAITHGAGGGASDRGTQIGVLHGTSPYDNYAPTYLLGNSDTNITNNSSVPFGFCL